MFGSSLKGVFGNPQGNPPAVAPAAAPVAPTSPFPAAAPGAPAPAAPSAPPAGLFAGMEQAKASEGGNYEREGHYIEKINRFKFGTSRKGKEFVVFEKTVLHVYDNAAGRGHKVGEDVSHMITRTANDMFLPNLKSIFAALAGCPVEQVTQEICDKIFNERLLDGMIVECFNRNITTKKGTLFTDVKYRKEVGAAELQANLTADEKAKFFPNGALEKAVAEGRSRV